MREPYTLRPSRVSNWTAGLKICWVTQSGRMYCPLTCCTSRAVDGKRGGGSAGAPVGQDVHEGGAIGIEGALQRRSNLGGIFDVFAMTVKRFSHLVEARVAKFASGFLAVRIGRPAAVQADDGH